MWTFLAFVCILDFMNDFPRVFLKSREEREILDGFPWVFDNEIDFIRWKESNGTVLSKSLNESEIENGNLVEVYAHTGAFLGTGVFNRASKIVVRIFATLHADKIAEDLDSWWDKAVRNAVNIRRLSYADSESCRLIFAEADFIPGLIVERYASDSGVFLVVQFLALSAEVFREQILKALINCCSPDGIFERSDADVRKKEGLSEKSGWIFGSGKEILSITENGIKLKIDIKNGQKTGYFLDQKENRAKVAKFCKGKKVLDTFTHTGAFALNAAKNGAKEVIACDISQDACEIVKQNVLANKSEKIISVVCKDVFDLLKEYESSGEKFDVIILDPPAFAKSVKQIQKAYSGYKEINLRAMRLLNSGGILVSCSCSHYFDEQTFYSMLLHAARDSHKRVQVLEKRGAASDHPILLGYPKSEYLKCAICRVL